MLKINFQLNEISRWYKPWFYEHVKSFLSKGRFEECIPLCDYYHRHTKSIFWELKVTFNLYHTFTGKTQYLGPQKEYCTQFLNHWSQVNIVLYKLFHVLSKFYRAKQNLLVLYNTNKDNVEMK